MALVKQLKILFLTANPKDTPALRLDQECREVWNHVRLAKHRDRVELVSRWAVRTDDLIQALLEEKPQVVHFSGHGEAKGLVLEDSKGTAKAVTPEALVAVLKAIPDNLRLAVFNACDSLPLAKAAVEVLDVAIGMKRPIGDDAAITFSAALYQGAAFGRTIQESFDLGLAALRLAGIPEESTPELVFKPGSDAKSLRFIQCESSTPPPRVSQPQSGAIALWREKLDRLLEAEAIETEAAQKFKLAKQIAEAQRKIEELGRGL